MEALSFEWLLAIGIVLVGLEALVFSFFLFPVGLGFLAIAFLELWVLNFESLFSQLATALGIGLVFIFFFRKKFIILLGKSSSFKEDKVHTSGIGIIDGEQIKFEGTYWNTDNDLNAYTDGDKVNIYIVKNKAVIKT
ncbi:hypothetical protein N8972_00185 [Sulfurospirillum sp.]|nr:hypothetical protein [Sulfurospirillum sp.]